MTLARRPLKVLIIHDSLLARRKIRAGLRERSDVDPVGSASRSRVAIELLEETKANIVVIEYQANEESSVLEEIVATMTNLSLVLVSEHPPSASVRGLGVAHVYWIPEPESFKGDNYGQVVVDLIDVIQNDQDRGLGPKAEPLSSPRSQVSKEKKPNPLPAPAPPRDISPKDLAPRRRSSGFHFVAIGVSTGGPQALMALVPTLDPQLPVPILIVIHMPKSFTGQLALSLQQLTKLRVFEAEHGQIVEPGCVYIAPGGQHMVLHKHFPDDSQYELRLNDHPPVNSCRPDVDVLFESMAPLVGANTLTLIMTGMGSDGALGAKQLADEGAHILIQDQASSVVWGMPEATMAQGIVNEVHPLDRLGARISDLVLKKSLRAS